MAAPGLPAAGMLFGLFDREPSAAAIERSGSKAVTLYTPLAVYDDPNLLTARGALVNDDRGISHHASGNVICHLQANARYGRGQPVEDRSGHSPALAHSKADPIGNARESEFHDDRVRLGPSTTIDHLPDALLVVAAVGMPIELQ